MISVVVPLYNYACYIEDNIKSILSQSLNAWELIIVDDASGDEPMQVIKPYLSDKIKYVRLDKNQGYGNAKNVGIRASRGEWIVVLDADDMLTPNSLKWRLKAAKKHGKKWVHAKAYEFGGRSPPYRFRFRKRKAIKRLHNILETKDYRELWKSIHAQTVMVHIDIYRRVGLYEPKLRSMGDKEMWARIINNVEVPLYVDKFVAYYRQHQKQMHRSKQKQRKLAQYEKILNRCIKTRSKGNLDTVERL